MSIGPFQRLLGSAFQALAPRVRALHARGGKAIYNGEVQVTRGTGLLSRMCGWATRLPPSAKGPITVVIDAQGGHETWTRIVGRHAMRSRLWADQGLLNERLGLLRFGFSLHAVDGALQWRIARVHALGVALPARWFGQVHASEGERDGRYTFDVRAALPLVGLLVNYRGWLDVE